MNRVMASLAVLVGLALPAHALEIDFEARADERTGPVPSVGFNCPHWISNVDSFHFVLDTAVGDTLTATAHGETDVLSGTLDIVGFGTVTPPLTDAQIHLNGVLLGQSPFIPQTEFGFQGTFELVGTHFGLPEGTAGTITLIVTNLHQEVVDPDFPDFTLTCGDFSGRITLPDANPPEVPEPATLSLVLLGSALVVRRRA